jgi:hypothetical protein
MGELVNPFCETRKLAKLKLLDLLLNNGHVSTARLLATFSLKTGLRLKTVLEYVSELEDTGLLCNYFPVEVKELSPAS